MLPDEVIEHAITHEYATLDYIDLTDVEKNLVVKIYREVNDKKVMYGFYSLRNRITKIEKDIYYIDDTIISYYENFFGEVFFKNDDTYLIEKYSHFRMVYYHLNKIYNNINVKDKTTLKPIQDDFLNDENKGNTADNTIPKNKYPHIFKSDNAYALYLKFVDTFKNDESKTAYFSYLFHAMQKDNLILAKAKRIDYIEALSKEGIFIDKVKTLSSIGHIKEKSFAYNSLKNK